MRAVVRAGLVVATLFAALSARADSREFYTVLGYDPGITRYKLGQTGSGGATRPSGVFTATAYYGLTNTWHVGARLRVSRTTNLHIGNAEVSLNGTPALGDVYEDHLGMGLDAVVLYRVDTRYPVAPLLELAGGFTSHQFRRIEFIPAGSTYTYFRSGVSYVALHGSGALLLEYRFATRWTAALGLSLEGESGDVPWALSFPVRLGLIW